MVGRPSPPAISKKAGPTPILSASVPLGQVSEPILIPVLTLVSQGCPKKIPPYFGQRKPQKLISHSSGGWESSSRCWQIPCLGRALFLVHGWPSCVDGVREFCGISFIRKGMNPIHEGSTLPKGPPPNTITLEIKFQHMNFGRDTYLVYSPLVCKALHDLFFVYFSNIFWLDHYFLLC